MIKSLIFFFFLSIINSGTLRSQLSTEWVRTYNGNANNTDEALSHAVDIQGNVYAAGKILNTGSGFDIYTVMYSSSGNILWERIYNGPGNGNDIAHSIALDLSGNAYVAGESRGLDTERDFILIKYNSQGDEQWNRRYNGVSNSADIASGVVVDNAGNPVISGTSHESASLFDIVTIKYGGDGLVQWIRQFNGADNGNDLSNDMKIDVAGDIYISGSTFGTTTINDFILIKYSGNGDELWTRIYNGPVNGNDNWTSLTLDQSGNAIISGSSIGSGTSLDFATIKYSPSGDELWLSRYTGPANSSPDEPRAITSDIFGNVFVTGTGVGVSTSYDYLTVKYSADGEELWARRYNGTSSQSFDEPRSIVCDNAGNAYVAGLSQGSSVTDDIAILKYDPDGNEVWTYRYNSPADRNDIANFISLDPSENIIVSGIVQGASSNNDFGVIKFSLPTGTVVTSNMLPSDICLSQNYPNPYNPVTVIRYSLNRNRDVSLKVFDALGKEAVTIVNEHRNAGTYEVKFDGSLLPSGVYFYTLSTDGFIDTKRMLLLK